MALLERVAQDINLLPAESRGRYSPYFAAWWRSLVQPRVDWATSGSLIEQTHLDMLGMLADLIESNARLANGGYVPNALDQVRNLAERLLSEVKSIEPTAGLSPALKTQIMADMEHVLWLVDHASTYGVARVVEVAEQATGRLTSAAATSTWFPLRKWAISAALVIGSLTAFGADATAITLSAPDAYQRITGGTVSEAHEVRVIVEACQPPKQIEPPASMISEEDESPDSAAGR